MCTFNMLLPIWLFYTKIPRRGDNNWYLKFVQVRLSSFCDAVRLKLAVIEPPGSSVRPLLYQSRTLPLTVWSTYPEASYGFSIISHTTVPSPICVLLDVGFKRIRHERHFSLKDRER